MFTPIAKKYSKEPSPRYLKEHQQQQQQSGTKLGLHRSAGRDSFGPVERKAGVFKNGIFRSSDFRSKDHQELSSKEASSLQGGSGLLLGSLQEPVSCGGGGGGSKYWSPAPPPPPPQEPEAQSKYSNSDTKGSYARGGGKNYSISPRCGVSTSQKGYGNQLLSLRAELSEKELQLVEIQQQHNRLICRSTDAFKKLEVAIKTKDQVIWQLHQALQSKQDELERQEKSFDEEKQALLQTTEQQKSTEIEQKDSEIAFLRTRAAAQLEELQQRDELIAEIKHQLEEEREKSASTPAPQFVYNQLDCLTGQVESLESTVQARETEIESQKQLCEELKALVWKRECMIGQLQSTEQQLQQALAKQTEAYNALESLKNKLQEEKLNNDKNLSEFKRELEALGSAALQDRHLKEDLKAQEACLQNREKQIQELQRILHAKDAALNAQCRKFQLQLEENQRLIEDYELLKQEYAALKQENLEELLTSNFQEAQCDIPHDQEILEIRVEDEDLMRPPKALITPQRAIKMLELPPQAKSPEPIRALVESDNELRSIEDEIGRREKEWRQTEAKMRAELCRRMAQLNELESFRPPQQKPEIVGGKLDSHRSSQFGSKKLHHF